MRSNLLSLQNIARQQDIVQNRLATGLKVSSAIDNPSAYYTAASLSNRAADLSALLDAMSQGVQTIKTASEAIDAGIKFLEQAKAVANQALESTAPVVARVSNEEELLAAVASGRQGLIVLDNDIVMSENQNIKLQDGQSLVGAAYFGEAKETSLTFKFNGISQNAIEAADGSIFSDFTINYDSDTQNVTVGAITSVNKQNVVVQNMDINVNNSNQTESYNSTIAVFCNDGFMTLRGTNNFNCSASSNRSRGIYSNNHALVEIEGVLNIKSVAPSLSFGIGANRDASIILKKGTVYNAESDIPICISRRSLCKSENDVIINVNNAFYLEGGSGAEYGGNTLYFSSGTQINLNNHSLLTLTASENINPNPGYTGNVLYMENNVQLKMADSASGTWNNPQDIFIDQTTSITLSPLNISGMNKISDEAATAPDINAEMDKEKEPVIGFQANYSDNNSQYQPIIRQYNSLIKDASYKGINLLDGQKLKINFNEDRSSQIDVMGVKADSDSLGLKTKEWTNAGDIEDSISELENAINTLRNYASAFGNYYSIVTTRQDFTENLINVLEEGADKLTLADMNQEAANTLALQTSQQLAVNSLSLASQASQAVLRLF